ncbi:fused MFS/spermidine synthase [Thermaurantiacus tibetensis]|uniref:spermidine synthase n=1 Tax=Thermaurantiacus tibetensis TaxID=2759035 RepID=UPI002E28FC77|nr:fused MFS/spermidine synthase [Thermaurantiacus tibetensis]
MRPLFVAIVGLGSFLLFLVQPLVARIALPLLGGAPSVWNTAMVFYQAALLAGYAYAHALQRLPLRAQAGVHLAFLLAAALTLPLGLPTGRLPPPGEEARWLLLLLAGSIGPLFVAIAAQAPLMQAWFARSRDPEAREPWFLYAASNAGSLGGLLAYPFLFEPFTALPFQQGLWSALYLVLVALVGAAALALTRGGAAAAAAPRVRGTPIPVGRQIRWVLLAAVPSGLMISTTTHITTDIMAMPLLWVLPLSLYLLSFILVFGRHGARWFEAALLATPVLLLLFGAVALVSLEWAASLYGLASLFLLFAVAVALHGALAMSRPDVGGLTRFYLLLALGGVLGGLFAALLAPLLFDWVWEHPLLLLAAALLLPARPISPRLARLWAGRGLASRALRVLTPGATLALSFVLGTGFDPVEPAPWQVAAVAALVLVAVLAIGRPIMFSWAFAMLMLGVGGWQQLDISTIEGARTRSFFGIYTIQNVQSSRVRRLLHGTTLHGVQSLDPARARLPMSYYAPDSGVGRAMRAVPALFGPGARVGFVGLGAGTLACYAKPGQRWTAFEIDEAVVGLAVTSGAFTYVGDCKPDLRIILGDARLTLARQPPGSFDLLAVDAFSSDSVPLHLLTVEALRVYMQALAPDGLLLLHVSNRFLDLERVVAAAVAAEGLAARRLRYTPAKEDLANGLVYGSSDWVLVTRTEQRMAEAMAAARGGPNAAAEWEPLKTPEGIPPWTDGHASILRVLKPLPALF